jgi:hypothetical protein
MSRKSVFNIVNIDEIQQHLSKEINDEKKGQWQKQDRISKDEKKIASDSMKRGNKK